MADDKKLEHQRKLRESRSEFPPLPALNHEGLRVALNYLKVGIRFNTRKVATEIRRDLETWITLSDRTRQNLRLQIEDMFMVRPHPRFVNKNGPKPVKWQDTGFNHSINALMGEGEIDGKPVYHVDPFLHWLMNDVPEWDGKPRLDSWIGELFTIDMDKKLFTWACKSVLLAAVKRALHPGTKHDIVVVLIDPKQGSGKSTMWQNLFPEKYQSEWFSDSLDLNLDYQKRFEACAGKVIVEIGEMAGSTRTELANTKNFITKTQDTLRLPYRRDSEDIPRRFVLVGTDNDAQCLPNDPTGNRRWIPVPVSGGDPGRMREWMSENREQLWAEAWHRRDEQTWLPDEVSETQAEHNRLFKSSDVAAERRFDDFLKHELKDRNSFSVSEIHWDGRYERISKAIQNTGNWEYKVIRDPKTKKQRRMWVRVSGESEGPPDHIPHVDNPLPY